MIGWDLRSLLTMTQLGCISIVKHDSGRFIKSVSFMIFATDLVEVCFDYHIIFKIKFTLAPLKLNDYMI
jgi:hypothetical protein